MRFFRLCRFATIICVLGRPAQRKLKDRLQVLAAAIVLLSRFMQEYRFSHCF
jgi:hypothetical protein